MDFTSPTKSLGSPKTFDDAQSRIQIMEIQMQKLRHGVMSSTNDFNKEKGLLQLK